MGELMAFWDSIVLARDQVHGDFETERQRLREFLALRLREHAAQQAIAADGTAPRR
jgi:hypothetical protein